MREIFDLIREYLLSIPDVKKCYAWRGQFDDVGEFNQASWPAVAIEFVNESIEVSQDKVIDVNVTARIHVGDFFAKRDEGWIFELRDQIMHRLHYYRLPGIHMTPMIYVSGEQDTSHKNVVDYILDFNFNYTEDTNFVETATEVVEDFTLDIASTDDEDTYNGTNGMQYRP